MTLLVFALVVLAVAALALTLLPVLRGSRALPGRARYDAAVYRDQLREVERDVARGLITADEAAPARLEIERRLLAAAAEGRDGAAASRRSPVLAGVLALLVVGGAGGMYLRLGAPGVPDAPFALRVAGHGDANHPDMAKLAAALGEKLGHDPNNAEGWLLYARTLASTGNWQASADAYRHRIGLGGADADTYAAYGEMLVLAGQGVVTPPAHEAFGAALQADPAHPVARYYLALADAEAGRGQAAIDAWVKLAGETADPAMRAEIGRRVADAARLAGLAAPPLPPPPAGPGAAAMAAVAGMPPDDQAQMVHGMVDQLAARLAANPNDADGWMRLGRAYGVLAEADQAAAAYEKAASLRPADAEPLIQGAEALLSAVKAGEPMPARAVAWLRRAETLDAGRPEVLWYLGVADAEAGHPEAAGARWRRLLEALPADSPDRTMVEQAIAAVGKK